MLNINLIDHIQTAVAVIDKNMTIIEANQAYINRTHQQDSSDNSVIGKKCFDTAYNFNEPCNNKASKLCPVKESFSTKQVSSEVQHFWINDHAIVEELTATPIFKENGEVKYVIEEFRDVSALLGLNKGILTACSYCKKIKESENEWVNFDVYLNRHTSAKFSHGICNTCKEETPNKPPNKLNTF